MSMEREQLRKILEGAILAVAQPMKISRMLDLFQDEEEIPSKEEVVAALEDIQANCQDRGFELKEVGSGWRFQVREEMSPWVGRLWDEKPQKYSRALLETLSLIAYRQPITRGDIEEIRGVAVSSHIIKTLSEREWIKAVGHRDVPGRPSLYATTRQFLDYFNLKSLEELPTLGEIRDLDELNKELDLGIEKAVSNAAVANAEAANAEVGNAAESEEPADAETSELEAAAPDSGGADGELDPDFDDSFASPVVTDTTEETLEAAPQEIDHESEQEHIEDTAEAVDIDTEETELNDVNVIDDAKDNGLTSSSLEESHDA